MFQDISVDLLWSALEDILNSLKRTSSTSPSPRAAGKTSPTLSRATAKRAHWHFIYSPLTTVSDGYGCTTVDFFKSCLINCYFKRCIYTFFPHIISDSIIYVSKPHYLNASLDRTELAIRFFFSSRFTDVRNTCSMNWVLLVQPLITKLRITKHLRISFRFAWSIIKY